MRFLFSSQRDAVILAVVVLLEDAVFLQLVDIPSQQNIQRLQANNSLVSGTSSAVTNSPTVWTQPTIFILTFLVVFQAVTAILPLAYVLIISIE